MQELAVNTYTHLPYFCQVKKIKNITVSVFFIAIHKIVC